MTHVRQCVLALAASALGVRGALGQKVSPAGAAEIVHQGTARGVPPCVSCHGPQLMGLAAMASPRLAGQDSAYVLAQLDAYVSGARNDAVMHPVASLLSPAEREAVA
ncbi:MAG: hypothetical protein WBQ26_14455, partial [Gemmatimonadaceae bacterium]